MKMFQPQRVYQQLVASTTARPIMAKMRGSLSAPVLLIAPPATEAEYAKGVPLSDFAGQTLHIILEESAGWDTQRDALVVCCSLYGVKPNKASTQPIRDFVLELFNRKCYSGCIAVGEDAFRFIFGRGLKPSMASIVGQTMYVPETKFAPLFVLPNIGHLHSPPDGLAKRDWWCYMAVQEELKDSLRENLAQRLTKFIKEVKCQKP